MKSFCSMLSLLFLVLFFQTAAAQEAETKPVRVVKGGIRCGKATSLPTPAYPKEAKKAGVFGAVQVQVLVGVDGRVELAEALSGPELLRKPSEQAALAARFAPVVISGEPVKVSGVIVYNFLDDAPDKSKK